MSDALARARALHRAGRLEEAEAGYRRLLEREPRDPEANHLLGLLAYQTGRGRVALEHIAKAIELDPGASAYHANLGAVLSGVGRFREAIDACRRATVIDPTDGRAQFNLGVALEGAGAGEEAAEAFRRAWTLAPGDAEACANLGAVLLRLGRPEEAREALERAVELDPASFEAAANLGAALQHQGETSAAAAAYRHALAIERRPETLGNLGAALIQLGDPDGAEAALREGLAADPGLARLWRLLSSLGRVEPDSPDVAAMEAALERVETDAEACAHLCFALGKAYDDIGRYPEAFAAFARGNALVRASFEYPAEAEAAVFAGIRRAFGEAVCRRAEEAPSREYPPPTPIFVVGMPRSGTTLAEQILASHPWVDGGGELTDLGDVVRAFEERRARRFPEVVPELREEELEAIALDYLGRLRRRSQGAPFVTDKLPFNFLRIGLIRLALPAARIVHCRRDPMDTCLSCYTTYFTSPQRFAYDLGELGRFHRRYTDLMAHWEAMFPGRIFHLDYERMVEDPEGTTRALLEACGLPWDPSCLEFYRSGRAVRTASALAVRRPVYRASVGRWRRYARELEPLAAALAGSGETLNTCSEV